MVAKKEGGFCMNLPNKITVLRLVLVPFVMFFYLMAPIIAVGKLIAMVLFLVAVLTDFLDGYLARKLNLTTNLGAFLDSIADKILVLLGFLLVVCDGTIPAPYGIIVFAIIEVRELMISALRQLAASKNIVLKADMWGKVKATLQFFCVTLLMLLSFLIDASPDMTGFLGGFYVFMMIFLGLTVVATLVSGVHYLVKNKVVFCEKEKSEKK